MHIRERLSTVEKSVRGAETPADRAQSTRLTTATSIFSTYGVQGGGGVLLPFLTTILNAQSPRDQS